MQNARVIPHRSEVGDMRSIGIGLIAGLAVAGASSAADVRVTLGAGDGFAIRNNTGAIERLRVDEATGNVSRNGALFVHTTGANSVFVGSGAGNAGITGTSNSAVGQNALQSNTTGSFNSAFGREALRSNTTPCCNAAFGSYALKSNTTGGLN